MVLTDGWKKDVAALVREADVAGIAEIDGIGNYYEKAQEGIVDVIEIFERHHEELAFEDVFAICGIALKDFGPGRDQLDDLATSICSRLGIIN